MKSQKWKQRRPLKFTPEETLLWLDGYRRFIFEVWKNNPKLRKKWENLYKIKKI